MKLEKDFHLNPDIIIEKGATVHNLPEESNVKGNKKELKKIKLLKSWHPCGAEIETASIVFVGEYRGKQLADKGFCTVNFDTSETVKKHLNEAQKRKKDSEPQIVKHIIQNEDGSISTTD